MAQKLPDIDIIFKQLAVTAVERSERGTVGLIIFDDTNKTFNLKTYELSTDVDEDTALYTKNNLQYIKDCFWGKPKSVTVIRVDKDKTIADALKIVKGLKVNWVGIAEGTAEQQEALALWCIGMENLKKTFKALVYNSKTPPDCKHVVNFGNVKITFTDNRAEQTGEKGIAVLLGYLAGANVLKGSTYQVIAPFKTVEEPDDLQVEVNKGKLMLMNDEDKVKIALGVNSLTTVDAINTEDMQKIEIIEAMDLVRDDITKVFHESWVGKFKNKLSNQFLFIASVNGYFKELAKLDILDEEYNNTCTIDIEGQRLAWLKIGKEEASKWDEAKVKKMTFKNQLFLAGDIKVLQSIEGLKFGIMMA